VLTTVADPADDQLLAGPTPGALSSAPLPGEDAGRVARVAAALARPLRYTEVHGAHAAPGSSTENDKAVIDAMTSPYLVRQR
jgi:hypothetical protein